MYILVYKPTGLVLKSGSKVECEEHRNYLTYTKSELVEDTLITIAWINDYTGQWEY